MSDRMILKKILSNYERKLLIFHAPIRSRELSCTRHVIDGTNNIRTTIILSIACLCFSGSFSAIQYFPGAQAQLHESTTQPTNEDLNIKMAQLSASNTPDGIATLAYIWGFPLVSMERQFNYVTSPNVPPMPGRGPPNSVSCMNQLVNASFTDVVNPNADTLYFLVQFDLNMEPVILVVPPISDRYNVFQLLDAYTNNYAYIGQRATGGTYLIAGPEWNGQVPEGMTKIWTPTNLAWLVNRILVNGTADVPNVNALQTKLVLTPLSVFGKNTTSQQSATPETNASKQVPIGPQPALIPTTGIKIFDEISQDMTDTTCS
jgi:hypothetical protein